MTLPRPQLDRPADLVFDFDDGLDAMTTANNDGVSSDAESPPLVDLHLDLAWVEEEDASYDYNLSNNKKRPQPTATIAPLREPTASTPVTAETREALQRNPAAKTSAEQVSSTRRSLRFEIQDPYVYTQMLLHGRGSRG
eukprot:CAMPEP_0198340176 /NCGR_PEP_ID=MMETSP1450-20131203/42730_1 /TAXON_ID=753684 ORGANISM="Madagascaria erythrocladiodes, Strain CCMP3234" /NCGR_SAMPLE_ID=MMETSP1450 /ASSEMBLY_ACC=CAM_ASM_001115 /LENGTH=138 /DNA_ID=CAMNT_0044045143 /DNA_START=100 /DNA_END=516 /DNA_ORIENTATION=+